jgi:hypothetical protein
MYWTNKRRIVGKIFKQRLTRRMSRQLRAGMSPKQITQGPNWETIWKALECLVFNRKDELVYEFGNGYRAWPVRFVKATLSTDKKKVNVDGVLDYSAYSAGKSGAKVTIRDYCPETATARVFYVGYD